MGLPSVTTVLAKRLAFITIFSLVSVGLFGLQATPEQTPPANTSDNFARGFAGAQVQIQRYGQGSFVPDITANSMIDDDVASGWTPPVGKTRVLVRLSQLADLKALTLFAPEATGTYSVYAANSVEEVESDEMTLLAENIDLQSETQTSLAREASLFVVLELDVFVSAPVRNLQITGTPNSGGVAMTTVVSPASGSDSESTSAKGDVAEVNFALKSLGGELSENDKGKFTDALLDGDTSTSTLLSPDSEGKTSTTIRLASAIDVDRVSVAIGSAQGKITAYSSGEDGQPGRVLFSADVDGNAKTLSFDVPGVRSEFVQLVWEPTVPGTPLSVQEVGIFALARIERQPAAPGQGSKVVVNSPSSPNSLSSAGSAPPPSISIELPPTSSSPLPSPGPIEPRPVSG